MSTIGCELETEILDICQIKRKRMLGKKVVKQVFTTACAIAIKYKGLLTVLYIDEFEAKVWFAKAISSKIG